tara:strand:+ start:2154 stop:2336 length:183 start_codon:yes stop_codon:yes gene_type:complete
MNSYKIITYATVTTEYIVEAENKEEAEENFYDGSYLHQMPLDYHDEQIESITEVEETEDE